MNTVRRLSYVFLCIVPFLCFVVVGVRAFRLPGVYQAVGFTYFAAIAMAAWTLSAGAIRAAVQGRRLLGLAGTLLITPFALVALLWVGLGGPWQANPAENQMRYLVLIVMATAIAGGFVVLREALSQAGERFYATLGFAAIMLSGPLYLIWNTFAFGVFFAKEHAGEVPQALRSLDDIFDLSTFSCGLSDLSRHGGVCGFPRSSAMAGAQGNSRIHDREWGSVAVPRNQRCPVSGPESDAMVHQSRFYCRNPGCPIHHAFPFWGRLASARR